MFVCLFARFADLEPKLLDEFQPNLVWTSPWTLWVTSKYFFGLTPPRGGIILEKLKKIQTSPYGPGRSGILLRHLLRNFWGGFGGEIWLLFEWAERSEACQRVSQPTGAKQPVTSYYIYIDGNKRVNLPKDRFWHPRWVLQVPDQKTEMVTNPIFLTSVT